MIADIARTVGNVEVDDNGERQAGPNICVIEAGTGTGKTITQRYGAQLLDSLPPFRREMG